jgi:hypothetical protein
MEKLNLSKNWMIYTAPLAREAAEELALYCGMLREQAGLKQGQIKIEEIGTAKMSAPGIILNVKNDQAGRNGFSWQFENDKIEITGDSMRGLWNGVFDFLAALGIKWPNPGQEGLPQAQEDGASMVFSLRSGRAGNPALSSAQERKRLFIVKKTGAKERIKIVKWAAKNKYDALVFSLGDKFFTGSHGAEYVKLAKRYALVFEAGGCDLSLLLPRRLFTFHRDLFRMEEGKRKKNGHFCPTNPETTFRAAERARYYFSRAMAHMTIPRVFHLLPDEGHENTWCACPACRAFSPDEQNIIAVNTAADALVKLDQNARLSFFSPAVEPEADEPEANVNEPVSRGITPRKNMFRLPSPAG